jgi:hypothetical protein
MAHHDESAQTLEERRMMLVQVTALTLGLTIALVVQVATLVVLVREKR